MKLYRQSIFLASSSSKKKTQVFQENFDLRKHIFLRMYICVVWISISCYYHICLGKKMISNQNDKRKYGKYEAIAEAVFQIKYTSASPHKFITQ